MKKIFIVLLIFLLCSCSTFFNSASYSYSTPEMVSLNNELIGVEFSGTYGYEQLRHYSTSDILQNFNKVSQLVLNSDYNYVQAFHNIFSLIKYYQSFDEYVENPECIEDAFMEFIFGSDGSDNFLFWMFPSVFSYQDSFIPNTISSSYSCYEKILDEASPFGEFYINVLSIGYKHALGLYITNNLDTLVCSNNEKEIIASFGISAKYLETNFEYELDNYFAFNFWSNGFDDVFSAIKDLNERTGLSFTLDISNVYNKVEYYIEDLINAKEEKFSERWGNRYSADLYSEVAALGGDGELYERLISSAQAAFKFEIDNAPSVEKINEIQNKPAYVHLGMEEYAQAAIDTINARNVEYEEKYNELLAIIYSEVTSDPEIFSKIISACEEFFSIFNSGKTIDELSDWKNYPFITELVMKDVTEIYNNTSMALDLYNWISSDRYSFIIESIPSQFLDAPLFIGHNGISYKNTGTTLRDCISSHDFSDIDLIVTPTGFYNEKILIEQFFESFDWNLFENIRHEISITVSIDSNGNAVMETAFDDTKLILYSENYKDIEYVFNKIFSGTAKEEYENEYFWDLILSGTF